MKRREIIYCPRQQAIHYAWELRFDDKEYEAAVREDALLYLDSLDTHVWACFEEGKLLGIGGVRRNDDGSWAAWITGAERLADRPYWFHRQALKILRKLKEMGVERLEAPVIEEFDAGRRWIERLGFDEIFQASFGNRRAVFYEKLI